MAKLKIETDVETLGSAQEFLRSVISALNRGFKSGKGWVVGEGEVPTEQKDEQLEILAQQFKGIVKNQNLTPEDVHEAMQWVFPEMLIALNRIGYGIEDDIHGGAGGSGKDDELGATVLGNEEGSETSEKGAGSSETDGDGTKVEGDENAQPGAPQGEKKGGGGIFPWQK